MSFDYTPLVEVTASLLREFGGPVMLTRRPDGFSVDPVTGATAGEPIEVETIGITQSIPYRMIDGTRVLATDRMMVLSGEVEPRATDLIDGWTIEEIREVRPRNMPIVYFVRLRK